MSNFSINFSHPWLLLLLIPAAVLLVVAMMRVPGKYRNTRNRVISVVLEAIVFLCVVLLLAGMTFTYTTGNAQNEIILLVDVTETMDSRADERDEYVQSLIYEAESNSCKVGIVTFGFTQVYAVPLTTDYENVFDGYKKAGLPDTSATDIAAAMEYAAKLFTEPETSKIVIISDGKETDESAVSSLAAITSQGTVVDSIYVPSEYEADDVQIISVELPDYHVNEGDVLSMTLNVQSNYGETVTSKVTVTDNGEAVTLLGTGSEDGVDADLDVLEISGTYRTFTLRYRIIGSGLHAIKISLGDLDSEILTENNSYSVYLYIDDYNRILIFQSQPGESDELIEALQGKDTGEAGDAEPYVIRVYTLSDYTLSDGTDDFTEGFPLTVDELRMYDLVILDNASNADMYEGYWNYLYAIGREGDFYSYFYTSNDNKKSGGGLLPQLLYTYVYTYGGGLLTVGGVTDSGETDEYGNPVYTANMYSQTDMYGTVLQQMLPVTAITYTPPTAIVVLIDTSGSMGSGDSSNLSYAINGVMQALGDMSERDYMGVVEFSSDPHEVIGLTSLVYKSEIQAALNYLLQNPQSGGTRLSDAFLIAYNMLEEDSSLYERKHIVIVTDGDLSDTTECYGVAESCNKSGVTVSAVCIGDTDGYNNMRTICQIADGSDNVRDNQKYIYDCSGDKSQMADRIREDVEAIRWEEVNYELMQAQVPSSMMFSSLLSDLFSETYDEETDSYTTDYNHIDAYVRRFYGTTIKSGATLVLSGNFSVPIYAQWSYGEGMVGSFMCDLHNYGDADEGDLLLDYESGIQFVINVVDNLMPSEDIRPNGLTVNLNEDNYTNRLTVYADVKEGYTIDAKVYSYDVDPDEDPGNYILDLNTVTEDVTDDLACYVTVAMTDANNYSRASFVIKDSGVYKIVVTMRDENGNVVLNEMGTAATTTLYKRFSYSAEYDNFNAADGEDLLNSLSTSEFGAAIKDADDLVYVFSDLVTKITKNVDPRLVLAIVALALFLLGIAVRKFKFKWPHEIIRDRRIKKEKEGKNG